MRFLNKMKNKTITFFISIIFFFLLINNTNSYSNTNKKNEKQENIKQNILNSKKEQIIAYFKNWKRVYAYEKNVDPNSLKFENNDLIILIFFNKNNIAEGVSFLSQDISDTTGFNSYVNKNYNKLLNWATNKKNVLIDKNRSTKYPVDLHIGNIHD